MRCTENCHACTWLALVNRMGPILLHNNTGLVNASKLNKLGCEVFPRLPYSPDLSTTDYHLLKDLDNFSLGRCFLNQQEAENAFQEFIESQSMNFYAQE